MGKLKLATRLRLVVGGVLICVIGVVWLLMLRSAGSLLDIKLQVTVDQVQQAHKLVQGLYDQAKAGSISEAEAKAQAAAAVGKVRYSGGEYMWINDMAPRMVMHPIKPELNGQDLSGTQDPKGKHLFREFVQTVRTGGSGYVDYLWPKPGATQPEPKRSYVLGFEPWGWVIGSGVYVDDVHAVARRDAGVALGLVLVLGVASIAALELLVRQLRGRLAVVRGVMQAVAAGDLRTEVRIGNEDEVGVVLRQVEQMQQQLRELVVCIRDATTQIELASGEVAIGSQDLSMRTEQTATSLQQTAASMQELTQQVRHSADAADETNRLAGSAAERAHLGAGVMKEVVHTMEGISASSRKIADIIAVIDGVAFQTNILALNAAVEAARAGDQGRGFAVVAAEVRNLAQRSAQAAKEIRQLILDSVERVQSGTQQVGRAGDSMNEILAAVRHVTNTVREISQASAGQSQGISQVNQAVAQLDSMTQQNAALVEQATASAEAMRQQAQQLKQLVSVFKLAA